MSLRLCAGFPEPLKNPFVISNIFLCAGVFVLVQGELSTAAGVMCHVAAVQSEDIQEMPCK